MSTNVSLFFAAVNIGCADPAGLADFWGKVLGREVTPGLTAPEVRAVGTTDPGGRPQMVFHPAPEAERVIGGFVPTLQTEHHDEETKRLTDLGAKLVNEDYLPPIRLTVFADPEGNRFQLATFKPE
jgi:predicted enzyme related to lactoylglutathione lyase